MSVENNKPSVFLKLDDLDLPITVEEFLTKSKALYIEAFPSSQLLPGAERLTRHLAAHHIPIGKSKRINMNTIVIL